MKSTLFKQWLIIVILLVSLNASAKSDTDKSEKLNRYLDHIAQNMNFSGEVLIMKNSEVLFNHAVGWSSQKWSIPNKVNKKYHLASITKSFTAVLILKAVELEKVKLTDHVIQYIPKLATKFNTITINQLLMHESGITHYQGVANYWHQHSKMMMNTEQMIALINDTELEFTPGTKVSYSSFGYYLLGVVLEELYQQPLADILEAQILLPLGMSDTGSANTLKIINNLNEGYHITPDNEIVKAPHRNYSSLKASGDMYSSSVDLAKWHQGLVNNQVLSHSSTELLFQKGTGQYAMGWKVDHDYPQRYYHGGGTWGYSSYHAIYPDQNISLIILANISTLAVDDLASAFEKIIFNDESNNSEYNHGNNQDEFNKYGAGHVKTESKSGNYKSLTSSRVLRIINQQDKWYAQMGGNPPFQIKAHVDGQFYGSKVDVLFTFISKDDGTEMVLAERQSEKYMFEKIK